VAAGALLSPSPTIGGSRRPPPGLPQ